MLNAAQITQVNESSINPNRYIRFLEGRFRLSGIMSMFYFTKFTFLFTILVLQDEIYQSSFVESNLKK